LAKQENVLTVEIDGEQNQNVYFRPLLRKVRGRFDLHRCREPNAGKLHAKWPQPIPGQRLELNLDSGEAFVVEPLWEEKFAALRETIEASGQKLTDERQAVKADVSTWIYWLKSLVETGKAKLLSGSFPRLDSEPQKRFHSIEQPDPLDRLAAAIEKQSELLAKLVSQKTT